MTRNLKKLLVSSFAVFCFVVSAPMASADYSVWQNKLATSSFSYSSLADVGGEITFPYTATSSITLFDRIDIALCRLNGTIGGSVELEIRSSTTTGPIIASSTVVVNNGNVWNSGNTNGCDYDISGVPERYTTFVLNNNIQTVSGVTWWVRLREVGTSGDVYVSANSQAYTGWTTLDMYIGGVKYWNGSSYTSVVSKGFALGSVPTNQNQGVYNASTTASVCTSFDVGCYLTTAFAWAFYPTIPLSEQLSSIASSTANVIPFGYVFGLKDAIDDAVGNATSTLSVTVELSGLMNFLGGSYSSSTVTVMSGSQIRTAMGTSTWSFVQTLFQAGIWIAFIFYVYRRSIKFL